ncbi:MAG: PadR family transcriptional regulator [Desulfobacteraceae bacterium]|nr:PadR family transcriptional regulator [Desulfobacteraceae bacterium]
MAKVNKTRYAILGLLNTGPMSGYDIKKHFEQIASNFWSESYGQIYPILKRLDTDGLATRAIEKQVGKPDRHIYTLTSKGQDELMVWLKQPVERHVGRHEILLKLIFGSAIPVTENIKQLRHFQKLHEDELVGLKSIQARMKTKDKEHPSLMYWKLTARFGELVNEALIKWSRESVSVLEKMNGK